MARAKWTAVAQRELEDILYYIGVEQQRQSIAERIGREIHEKCLLYANAPELGTEMPDLGQGYRIFRYKRWAIIYKPRDYGLEVFGIVDATRDYPAWQRDV